MDRFGLDITIFKTLNGYEAKGECRVQRKGKFVNRKENYPVYYYRNGLGELSLDLMATMQHHRIRKEFNELLGGILTIKFPRDPEIYYPVPNGTSRMLIPLSQEEIMEFWQHLKNYNASLKSA